MLLTSVMLAATVLASEPPPCKTFEEIYANGKNLCEKMWGSAFKVPTDDSPAYDPTFPGRSPDVSKRLQELEKGTAHDGKFYDYDPTTNLPKTCIVSNTTQHRATPGPERLRACEQYAGQSCCKADVITSRAMLRGLYGSEHEWDRCGPLSSPCESFFVAEACLYECEPATKFFLKYRQGEGSHQHEDGFDPNNKTHVEFSWQLENMPLSLEFCNDWFAACRTDKFCAADNGNYFSCARRYEAFDKRAQPSDDGLEPGYIALVVIVAVVAVVALCFIGYLIFMEKSGKPIYYTPVSHAGDRPGEPTEMTQPKTQEA